MELTQTLEIIEVFDRAGNKIKIEPKQILVSEDGKSACFNRRVEEHLEIVAYTRSEMWHCKYVFRLEIGKCIDNEPLLRYESTQPEIIANSVLHYHFKKLQDKIFSITQIVAG